MHAGRHSAGYFSGSIREELINGWVGTQESSRWQAPRRTAGGIRVNVVKDALKAGADILVVGRAITASKDIHHATEGFLEQLDREEIDQFRVMTDF